MKQSGFGLLEILVSVLVLSVGLLGLASLHVTGMRANHSAYYRTQSTILAYEIIDRMRVNAEEARDGDYDVADISSFSSSTTLADNDLSAWKDNLAAVLPTYGGSIDCDDHGNCTVQVQWDDSRAERVIQTSSDTGDGTPVDTASSAAGDNDNQSRYKAAKTLSFRVKTRV